MTERFLEYHFAKTVEVGDPIEPYRFWRVRFHVEQIPGTDEAVARGCKCPPIDPDTPQTWVVVSNCPLHCETSNKPFPEEAES
jgi:hypothetical protein